MAYLLYAKKPLHSESSKGPKILDVCCINFSPERGQKALKEDTVLNGENGSKINDKI